ncbi:MAG: Na+/H+ antiporter NhaA [Actinomycetota bacterium]
MPQLPFSNARGRVARAPLAALEFLTTEAGGAAMLLAAAVAALVWANSPLREAYESLWHLQLDVGPLLPHPLDLREWVNEGLMTFFFLVVGLEIKREVVEGELRELKRAVLPVIAATGGMVVPALVYLGFNAGGAVDGWGIPMATDIAFAVGLIGLFGARVPTSLKVFLLAVAIVDDIGAIIVIAVFYAGAIQWGSLAMAVLLVAGSAVIAGLGVPRRAPLRVALVLALAVAGWAAMIGSGVHATLAGVLFAFVLPGHGDERHDALPERLERRLHPWTSRLVLPAFALANAGVAVSGEAGRAALGSRVAVGVAAGLVVGKLFGVGGTAWLATKLGVAEPPEGVTGPQMFAISATAGIGFTVSLFIAPLAFQDAALIEQAKVGILAGSLVAALIGVVALALATRPPRAMMDP